MAQFRIGDKARIVKALRRPAHVGMECVIVRGLGQDPNPANERGPDELVYLINIAGNQHPVWGHWSALPWQLAPLTDPPADAFIARLKKLGTEPVNDAPKVTVREGK